MPQFPFDSPDITVEAMLKDPTMIARALTDIAAKRYAADRVLTKGTPDQVASGSVIYQESESIFPDNDVEELAMRTEYPRTGWSETVLTAEVKKYGLEMPIADEAIRRNSLDQVLRGLTKLANGMVKYVDSKMIAAITGHASVLTGAASADWSTGGTDIIGDIIAARQAVKNVNEGYEPDTIVMNPAQETDILMDADIRSALSGGGGPAGLFTAGELGQPFLGIRNWIVTPNLAAGTVLIGESKMVGTIADEAPGPNEGYVTFAPGATAPATHVKVYREEGTDTQVVRAVRWPAIWIAEPRSFYKVTSA